MKNLVKKDKSLNPIVVTEIFIVLLSTICVFLLTVNFFAPYGRGFSFFLFQQFTQQMAVIVGFVSLHMVYKKWNEGLKPLNYLVKYKLFLAFMNIVLFGSFPLSYIFTFPTTFLKYIIIASGLLLLNAIILEKGEKIFK